MGSGRQKRRLPTGTIRVGLETARGVTKMEFGRRHLWGRFALQTLWQAAIFTNYNYIYLISRLNAPELPGATVPQTADTFPAQDSSRTSQATPAVGIFGCRKVGSIGLPRSDQSARALPVIRDEPFQRPIPAGFPIRTRRRTAIAPHSLTISNDVVLQTLHNFWMHLITAKLLKYQLVCLDIQNHSFGPFSSIHSFNATLKTCKFSLENFM